MFASGSQLAQSRPANTSTATAFTAKLRTEITRIVIANTTASPAAFSLYHDDDGTTYDETTALYFAEALAANTSKLIDFGGQGGGIMVNTGGAIGIKSGTNSALTFTMYGITAAVVR